MKLKTITLALILTLGVSVTALANEETSEEFYNRPGAAYYVKGDYVRVRTHPSTDGYIICEMRKGVWVKDFGSNSPTHKDNTGRLWRYIVMSDGNVGWVCDDYLDWRC